MFAGIFLKKLILSLSCIATFFSFASHADELEELISKQRDNFATCLTSKVDEALASGVSQSRIDAEFDKLEFVSRVIELDRRQPEFISTFPDYYSKRVNKWRIDRGREKYQEYRSFLKGLTEKYGIPGHYLIAFWGLETNYGGYKGKMSTLDSLATLACDHRRSAFFTKELFLALKLMDREKLVKDKMLGSWAGAMGHTQFMPSSYTQYAIDGDGDGQANLWESEKDALSSAANFLWKLGWIPGLRWGREVKLPQGFDYRLANSDTKSVNEWRQLGVRKADDSPLDTSDIPAKLLVPAGHQGPAFLSYANFKTILRWNNSEFYGIAVGRLATRISGGGELQATLPDIPAFSIAEMRNVQQQLNTLGYDVGTTDGIMGPATRNGIRKFQMDSQLVADGFPSKETLSALRTKALEKGI
ncbi:lytic murein transglycosylase [Agaribacter flavus]|uniref:Lytic murein transglycosylase n=1 Tax=Agaribacter flavus TaxID=1902781 RepID=A0ABV7FUH7_9ALTE